MFDEDHRRLVQVASIANAIAAAENASPWRALLWLAEQVEAGNLVPRLFTTVTMNTVDAAPSSPEHSLRIWRKLALRTQAERAKNMLHYHLPAAASTWHVHARDLMQFAMAAEMADAVRAELLELARQHGGPTLAPAAVQAIQPAQCQPTQVPPMAARTYRSGRNVLAPVIDRCRATAADPSDTAQVWAELERLARLPDRERPAPLAGVNSGGVQWHDGGALKTLTRKAFGDKNRRFFKQT